jgi:hypothetical protein
MALEGYEVHPIDSPTALAIVKKNHYLHRAAPASHCFGLFDEMLNLVGVAIYGIPASPSLCRGLAGEDEAESVLELTRLWIADWTPKNAESFLISRTLKELPLGKDLIVSFAEIAAGHAGTIYQATNWLYTGLSDRHVEWLLDGEKPKQHTRHLFDQYGGVDGAKAVLGDRLQRSERGRKHRYVFLRGSKKRRKELLQKLRYDVMPYPSADSMIGELV